MGKLQGLEDKSRHQNCTELTLTNGNLNLISACNFIRVFAHCTWTWPLPGIGDGSGIEDWTSVFLQGDHFEMHKSSFYPDFSLTVGSPGSFNINDINGLWLNRGILVTPPSDFCPYCYWSRACTGTWDLYS